MNKELRSLLRTSQTGDAWGDAMGEWFAIAGVLDFEGEDVPTSWQYRPSPIAHTEDELRESDPLADLLLTALRNGDITADDLREVGNVLDRYTTMLRNAGRDY